MAASSPLFLPESFRKPAPSFPADQVGGPVSDQLTLGKKKWPRQLPLLGASWLAGGLQTMNRQRERWERQRSLETIRSLFCVSDGSKEPVSPPPLHLQGGGRPVALCLVGRGQWKEGGGLLFSPLQPLCEVLRPAAASMTLDPPAPSPPLGLGESKQLPWSGQGGSCRPSRSLLWPQES